MKQGVCERDRDRQAIGSRSNHDDIPWYLRRTPTFKQHVLDAERSTTVDTTARWRVTSNERRASEPGDCS